MSITTDGIDRHDVLQQVKAFESKLEAILAGVRALVAQLSDPEPEEADTLAGINPLDERNKIDGVKLSPRGEEVCYRMFDAGKTRYAVKEAMNISYSAASYRFDRWVSMGGANRMKQPLD
jgi:hypothetical protein